MNTERNISCHTDCLYLLNHAIEIAVCIRSIRSINWFGRWNILNHVSDSKRRLARFLLLFNSRDFRSTAENKKKMEKEKVIKGI